MLTCTQPACRPTRRECAKPGGWVRPSAVLALGAGGEGGAGQRRGVAAAGAGPPGPPAGAWEGPVEPSGWTPSAAVPAEPPAVPELVLPRMPPNSAPVQPSPVRSRAMMLIAPQSSAVEAATVLSVTDSRPDWSSKDQAA